MALRLQDKLALVTAAGQGIGRAIAEAFVAEGAKVIATDVDVKKLKGLKKATLAKLDARSTADVNTLVKEMSKKLGPIDVLVNAAGYVHHGTVLDATDAEWDFAFDLNVRSMDRAIKATLPGMLKKGKGSIINIASGASSVRGIPFRYVYGTTKAAVIGLTKSVAADYIRKGIRSNAICPGTIESPSLDDRIATLAKKTGASEKVVRQQFIDRQPMGRLGTPQEIAAPAGFTGRVEAYALDVSREDAGRKLVSGRPDAIFHLAAVVSGEAEADFEKGYRINLVPFHYLLEAIRCVGGGYHPKLVFTSSI